KEESTSGEIYDHPLFNFYKDVPDDQWIRTTDFTPCGCIGQSSALVIELPFDQHFPDFRENFGDYEESDGRFTLEPGVPFSSNLDLVPIVSPPQGIQIPYDILFKVNALVQHGCLSGPSIDDAFYRLVDPCRIKLEFIEHALERIYYSKEFCYEPIKWLSDQYRRYIT
ncbi:hypothetical protein PIB30_114344, partial [Stylosanthes scabra]|nr:hypothetical protein [Stylosanthes scabra]